MMNLKLKLRPWVPVDKLCWAGLSRNPAAISLLEQNSDKIRWRDFSSNPAAIMMLKQNPEKINWTWFSANPAAVTMLNKNPENINWDWIPLNPEAISILKCNPDKMNWEMLKYNTNPIALSMHENNQDKNGWDRYLLGSYSIFDPNNDKISCVSRTRYSPSVEMLRQKLNNIEWNTDFDVSSANQEAITLIKQNMDIICWNWLSSTSSIFTYDYAAMRTTMHKSDFFRELQEAFCHPTRVLYYLNTFQYNILEDEENW